MLIKGKPLSAQKTRGCINIQKNKQNVEIGILTLFHKLNVIENTSHVASKFPFLVTLNEQF